MMFCPLLLRLALIFAAPLDENEFMQLGMKLSGFQGHPGARDKRRFRAWFGPPTQIVSELWSDLIVGVDGGDPITPPNERNAAHLLWALHFPKQYPIVEVLAGAFRITEEMAMNKVWYYVCAIAALVNYKVSSFANGHSTSPSSGQLRCRLAICS